MDASAPPVTERRRFPGRFYSGLAILIAFLGLGAYVAQVNVFKVLTTPWYMPGLASLGVVLMVFALTRCRTVWRFLGLGVLVLLAGAEWYFLLALTLPPYSGPVAKDKAFPDFATRLADGAPFARKDLEGPDRTVMVFFRGRW
jgi:hypothetical protein